MLFTLRDYNPSDFLTLWAIDQHCFAPGIAYTQFELKTFIYRRTAFTLVAESQGNSKLPPIRLPTLLNGNGLRKNQGTQALQPETLGFLIADRSRVAGHIITIDVRAEARHQRIGSGLLSAAEERLRLWNCRQVRLETAADNVAAISFYKRQGYSVLKVLPRYYSNGTDALALEKDLLSPAAFANVQK